MSDPDALKAEIARLTGAINRHKSGVAVPTKKSSYAVPPSHFNRSNIYVNPNYVPPKPPSRPPSRLLQIPTPGPSRPQSIPTEPREVVLGGVAFESSGRSLVRKDLPKLPLAAKLPPFKHAPRSGYARTHPTSRGTQRPYKPKSSRGPPRHHNMSLANGRKPFQANRKSKTIKYSDKQCSRFATTGVCQRGLTCPYQHDPSKVAICWPFLQGHCPNTFDSCLLSHDPTPERTPLCVHFANHGRCKNGDACLYPHVHVGQRNSVCRDFAVLGFCDKGLNCDKQHVRECPDFAENGTCPNLKCKLPHVIRANRNRKPATAAAKDTSSPPDSSRSQTPGSVATDRDSGGQHQETAAAEIGDEYISLTFHESESEEEDDDESDEKSDVAEEGERAADSCEQSQESGDDDGHGGDEKDDEGVQIVY